MPDDWGGIPVDEEKDDWGGVAVAEAPAAPVQDDWGGIPVDSETHPAGRPQEDYGTPKTLTARQKVGMQEFLADPANEGARSWFETATPENLAKLDVGGQARSGIDEQPTGVTQGTGINLKAATKALISPLTEFDSLLSADSGRPKALPDSLRDDAAMQTPILGLPRPSGDTLGAGAARGAVNLAEGLTTPENAILLAGLAGAPAAISKIAGIGLTAPMVAGLPEKYRSLLDARDEGNPAAAAEKAVELLGEVAMIGAAAKHAAGRPESGGIREGEVRPPSLSQDAVDSAGRQNQLRALTPDAVPLTKEGQTPVVPDTIDGLVQTRNRLTRDFVDQTPENQVERQKMVDEIDDQLLRFRKEDVQASEARIAQQGQSPPPAAEVTQPASTEVLPSENTGRSKLFEQAQRETTQESPKLRPEETAPETQPVTETGAAVESPVRGEVAIDPAIEEAIKGASERIADQVTKGQPDSVREAARVAALDNALGSLRAGKPHSIKFMRDSAKTAAGEAAKKQPVSLDAPSAETGISRLENEAAPTTVTNEELYKPLNDVLDTAISPRDSAIVRAVQERSMEYVASEFGLSKQRVSQIVKESLPKLREALEKAGYTKEDYAGGPGAMGPVEALEQKANSTSTKNAVMQAERLARGEDELVKGETVSNHEAIREARNVLAEDPTRGEQLAKELVNSTRDVRTISAADEAVLMAHKVELIKQRNEQDAILSDGDKTPEEHAIAKQNLDVIEAKMNEVDQATFASGQDWGRMGQLRQRMIREDYSLESMERRARIRKGDALTPEEKTRIKEQSSKIQELEKQLENVQKQREGEAANRAADAAVAELSKQAEKVSPRVIALAESIVTRLDKAADDARARIRDRFKNASSGVDPTVVYDVAVIGVSKLARASLDFAKWSSEMIADLGEDVRPYLDDAWKKTEELWDAEEKRLGSGHPVNKLRKDRAKSETTIDSVKEAIKARVSEGDKVGDLQGLVDKLSLEFVKTGINKRDPLVDAVHNVLKESIPNIERDTVRDLVSHYGEFKPLDKDAAKTTLRELRGELQQIGKIQDMQEGQAPKKTGVERRTQSDEERRLIKEVNELKKKGGFEVIDPEKQLKTSLDSIKTRLNNEIRDLDIAIATKERLPSKKNVVEYDKEAQALKDRRDVKKLEYDRLFPKEPLTQEQLVDRAGKALDRSISQLETDLQSGRLYGEKSGPKLSTPELDAKRARLEALRAQREELRSLDTATLEARSLAAYKTRTANRIADLQEKITQKDFAPKVAKDVKLDKEAMKLRIEMEKVKEQFDEDRLKYQLANRSVPRKIYDASQETLNASRAILTSIDFSAVLRQGGFVALGNPIRAAKALPDMFKAAVSEDAARRVIQEIKSRPNFDLYEKSKLYLSDTKSPSLSKMEEAYMSRWAKKIPGVAGSERAYTTFLNKLRADTFDALTNSLGGRGNISIDEAKVLASYINVATGRGTIGSVGDKAAALNTVFFSPRYVASRFQLMAGSPLIKGNARTRTAIAKEYAKFLGGLAVIYSLGLAAGGTVNTDETSADFGKMKFGNTRVDFLGGMLQNTVLLSRLAEGKTTTGSGRTIPIRGDKKPYGGADSYDLMARFARTKFAPFPGAVVDSVAGQNVIGQTTSLQESVKNALIPMSLSNVKDLMEDQGIPKGAALFILNLFGAGVNTYDTTKKK